jgi:hypothetical protein
MFSQNLKNSKEILNMKIGFAKSNLIEAIDWRATTSVFPKTKDSTNFLREEKFDISDRVSGMWRPENGGSRKIVQPLYISVLYGKENKKPFIILSIDHCEIEYQNLDIMREPILKEFNLSKDRVVFLPSHCHVTVKYDTGRLQNLIFNTIKQAKENLNDVEVATLNLKINGKKFVINRRIHVNAIGTRTIMFNDYCDVREDHLDANDQVMKWIRNLGGNPNHYVPENQSFKTHKDVDDKLQAIFFRDQNSKIISGSFIRFAAHAVIVSEKKVNGDISADYPGYMKEKIEAQLGGIALFAQGQAGDLRPLNTEYSHRFAKMYGEKLADNIISEFNNLKWHPVEKMNLIAKSVKLPLRTDLPKDIESGEENMKRIENEYDNTSDPAKRRNLQNDFWFYYRCSEVAKLLRPEWQKQGFIDSYLYCLKLNDIVLIMHSGEMFYSTGQQMVKPYEDRNPIIVSLTNECLSYIPPSDEIQKGGYEPSVCLVSPESAEICIKQTHELIEKIYKI